MTQRDGSDGKWTVPGLVTLKVERETKNDPETELQERITIITLRGPNDTMQRVVLSEGTSRELALWLR